MRLQRRSRIASNASSTPYSAGALQIQQHQTGALGQVFRPRAQNPNGNARRQGERVMLVLSRKINESIVINDDITIVVIEIRGDKVRLGVEAPKEVPVHRREVFDAIHRNENASGEKAETKSDATGNGGEE